MGITIFYQGALRDVGQMSQLTAQIQAVCARLQWPCRVVDERILGIAERFEISQIETDDGIPTSTLEIFPVRVDDHVRGIAIAPPDCETLRLIFDRDGRLIDYDSGPSQEQQSGRYGLINKHLWIKTQFSSPEVHIQVCELLRIVEPFMAEWEVTDDGGYWGVWDVQVLRTTWALSLIHISEPTRPY